MQISLENTFVRELAIHGDIAAVTDNDERTFDVKFDKVFSKDELSKEFTIKFKVKVSNTSEFTLSIVYDCIFITDSPINDEFKNSHFPNVNAPAIAYPYLRSYISFLTLNSGYEPAILPTINFTSFLQQSKEMNENSMI